MKRLPLLALLLVLAACGSGTEPSATPTPSSYQDCLRQQGIALPTARPSGTPGPRPSGMEQPGAGNEAMQKAMQACSSLRPSGGTGRPGGGEALTAYVNCLKDKGITWNPGDPAPTVDAAKVCEVLRPSRPAGQ